jgi:hypothetical protein
MIPTDLPTGPENLLRLLQLPGPGADAERFQQRDVALGVDAAVIISPRLRNPACALQVAQVLGRDTQLTRRFSDMYYAFHWTQA